MNTKWKFLCGVLLFAGIVSQGLNAQSFIVSGGLRVTWGEEIEIVVPDPPADYIHYVMEVTRPDGSTIEKAAENGNRFLWTSSEMGENGFHKLRFMPVFKLGKDMSEKLIKLRKRGDAAAIEAFRAEHGLVAEAHLYYAGFGVDKGKPMNPIGQEKFEDAAFFSPQSASTTDERLSASLDEVMVSTYSNSQPLEFGNHIEKEALGAIVSQVFIQDVIIQESLCVGFDCVNGESFGFSTIRLKENNLRIEFLDTSNSASFPSVDWYMEANSSSNGGDSYFQIKDLTHSRDIFTLMANAPSHSLFVSENGNIGVGTNNPGSLEINIEDGDTPTLRMSQNSSQGWSAQIWDVAGNETNFFVRDATNGSTLPFRIYPGSRTNSIRITANAVGLNNDLHIAGNVIPISDESLLQEVTPLHDALPIIGQLQPVSWDFDGASGERHGIILPEGKQYGLAANQLEQVLPDLVHAHHLAEEGPELKGVNYDGLIPFLIKAIQEQQTIINNQEQRIRQLEQVILTVAESK